MALGMVLEDLFKIDSENGLSDVSGIIDRGGTILGTTNRYNPFAVSIDRMAKRLSEI